MISTLHIKNIGIISDLTVELGEGFNVFTGETGAGKTLIIDAINIISGGRFSKEMIRKGEEYSFVELNLFLPKYCEEDEKNIVISREVHQNGRNLSKINGRLVTVGELKDFMNDIIDIHGQNDNQKILNSKNNIKYLDDFCKDDFKNILARYQEKYNDYIKLKNKLKENWGDEKEKQRRLDLLQYELDEIEDAKLKEGEETELKEKSKIFENSEKIVANLGEARKSTENSLETLDNSLKSLDKISYLSEDYNKKAEELRNIYYELEEFSRDLCNDSNDIYFDEYERDEVEKRIDLIENLKRKYGNSITEILKFKEKISKEISFINNLNEYNEKIKDEMKTIKADMEKLSLKLNSIREKYSKILSEKINNELADLEMQNARFIIKINKNEKFNCRGKDDVKFYISTNLGEDMYELNKIASGGEMSRIMLAIKTVLADTDNTPVMIFDEIDTGISGKAARNVAKKLKYIGKKHQVICITHQPSIAAMGDENYFISKKTLGNRTYTQIKHLKESEIINEIARLSNGDITEIAIRHASELRKAI